MKDKNPFIPGDRVVCLKDDWYLESGPGTNRVPPKKGDVLTVDFVQDIKIGFKSHNENGVYNWFPYWYFAPVQDATEMEFEESEFAHYEEMTA